MKLNLKNTVSVMLVTIMAFAASFSVSAEEKWDVVTDDAFYTGIPMSWVGLNGWDSLGNKSYPITNVPNSESFPIPEGNYGSGNDYRNAMKIVFENGGRCDICQSSWGDANTSLNTYKDGGYVRIRCYIETENELTQDSIKVTFWEKNGEGSTRIITFEDMETNAWVEKRVLISDILSNGYLGNNINFVRVQTNADFSGAIYINEIGYVNRLTSPELEISETKMDNLTGKFMIKGTFTKKMNKTGSSAVKKEFFTLGDIQADSVKLESDNQSVQILFDTMPEFPSEITLSISEGMKSKEGLRFEPTDMKIQTAEFQNEIFSAFYEDPKIEGSKVIYTPFIRFLYSGDENPQSVTVLSLLYNDGVLVNSSAFVTEAGSRKETLMPEVSIDIPLEATGTLSMDVYFIDSMVGLKPLSEKAVCTQIN